ncbi:gelsolin repeat protein [Geopyxis carbonaria]|nr:gelsolin repeat protein [Geopyxis carbonaria]
MEGSGEDVNDFLQRIKELGDRRDREDNERAKQLEAEIIAGRQARRARRDERARSISPQKESPIGTPASLNSPIITSRPGTRDGENPNLRLNPSSSASLEQLSGKLADVTDDRDGSSRTAGDGPRYKPALSWQRRPKSMAAPSSRSSRSSSLTTGLDDSNDEEKSRAQIAANLSTKEPAWFRQAQDRNASSGALRKPEEEEIIPMSRMALPGMSPGDRNALPESTPEPEKRISVDSFTQNDPLSPEQLASPMNPPDLSSHSRNASLSSNPGVFESISTEGFARVAMSPSQGRMSPERRERTPSPTKGLGGFVQSAMLKREGSVNKRWSSQQGGTLSRNNSTASTATTRPSYPTNRDSASNYSRESSPAPEDSPLDRPDNDDNDMVGRGRAQSISEQFQPPVNNATEVVLGRTRSMRRNTESTPPASPTKTFEPKRWSPTKSSWLEMALKKGTDNNQPASTPPPMKPLLPVQPMRPTERTPVKPIEPRSEKLVNLTPVNKPPINPKPDKLSPKPENEPEKLAEEKPLTEKPVMKPIVAEKPSVLNRISMISPSAIRRSPSPEKIEFPKRPVPGPKEPLNFRAGLKPRPQTDKEAGKEEPQFLDARARLRATKTQNYKAPDVLKKNILEGKAALNLTGGPQKNNRPDPVKETLISAKGALGGSRPPPVNPESKPRPAPGRIEVKDSSLASRFNPGLANFLQRGPPGAAGRPRAASERSNSDTNIASSASKSNDDLDQSSQSSSLTHMTKGRARGPKRRAPTKAAENTPPTTTSQSNTTPVKRVLPEKAISQTPEPTHKAITTPHKSDKPKPPTPAKSPLLRGNSSSSLNDTEKVKPSTPPPIPSPSSKVLERKASQDRLSPISSAPVASPLRAMLEEEKEGTLGQILTPTKSAKPLGISGLSPVSNLPSLVEPPKSRSLPKLPSRSPSPTPQAMDLRDNYQVLSEFFKGPSFLADRVDFDIIGFLSSSPTNRQEKVKTTKMEVSEITGYGKLSAVPQDRQHIFFDESMYLCIHHRDIGSGKQSVDVFLWCGGRVSEGAVEDAQLFARKISREQDGKLIQIRQGRETATFFQAIGGIVITRRGTQKSSALEGTFMLCGRSQAGGVAFDEVDMKVSSLCSGFPYILTTGSEVYVWKGRGATIEEVGAARLVGFEISGGEVKEFNEGEEDDTFFNTLGGYQDRISADYWHLRPSCKKYAARLFKIDLQTSGKVTEISPFCQSDLDPNEIYVADAFFEFYIVLGSQSQSKREEFQVALQFTQEYAILAVSIEDRPFLPVSSVILGGAPREFKALFRTWEDAKTPTTWLPTRKPSLRLLGLTEAMEALGV